MRHLRVTVSMLRRRGACQCGLDMFNLAFPRGVTITDDQQTNARIIELAWDRHRSRLICTCHQCQPTIDEDHGYSVASRVRWLIASLGYECGSDVPLWDLFAVAGMLADAVGLHLSLKRAR